MNTYEIRAFVSGKTLEKQIPAKSAKSAEKKFRRTHKHIEEIQIKNLKTGVT